VGSEWNVSALIPRSLTWDQSAFAKAPTTRPRRRFANEAVAWQQTSQLGGMAAFCSYVDESVDRRARRKDPNRIVELHAMIGAIGEQAGLWRPTRATSPSTPGGEWTRSSKVPTASQSRAR
jgi:hypothetical protein